MTVMFPLAFPPISPRLGAEQERQVRPESRSAVGAFLRQRVPILHLNAGIVLVVLGLYVLVVLLENHAAGKLWNPWALLASFVTPLLHVVTVAAVAPLAWRYRKRRSRVLNFLQGLVLAFLACELAAVLIVFVDAWLIRKAGGSPFKFARVLQLYLYTVGPTMMVLGGLIAARANMVEENQAVREEAVIARTRLLQSQLHPHVLFNALNGLAELIHKDPPKAERSVMHLADLLRRILRASEVASFSLGDERALLEDYLIIEGMRLGERLRLQWDWDATLNHLQIPPLLLQPLVENAIKHGIAPNVEGGALRVRAALSEGELTMEVWNSGVPYRPGLEAGIGLANLRARLDLRYGASGQFTIGTSGLGTMASIKVQGILLR